jgi:hypothetical protein
MQLIAGEVKGRDQRNKKSAPLFFKVAAVQYYFAHGGTVCQNADTVGVHESTMLKWIRDITAATVKVLEPMYMPWPPTDTQIAEYQARYSLRRAIGDCTFALDCSQCPWHGALLEERDDYQNYKNFQAIQAFALTTPLYTFAKAEVGYPGGTPDKTIYEFSDFMEDIKKRPETYLGVNGLIAVDGGFAQDEFCLAPFREADTDSEKWFNFCHSSTRLHVEQVWWLASAICCSGTPVVTQVFGMWKNRFRLVLTGSTMNQKDSSDILFATMLLHNLCCHNGETSFMASAEWRTRGALSLEQLLQHYPQPLCPECNRKQEEQPNTVVHCHHAARNIGQRISSHSSYEMRERRRHIERVLWARRNADAEDDAEAVDLR